MLHFKEIIIEYNEPFEFETKEGEILKFNPSLNNKNIDILLNKFKNLNTADEILYLNILNEISELLFNKEEYILFNEKIDIMNRVVILNSIMQNMSLKFQKKNLA